MTLEPPIGEDENLGLDDGFLDLIVLADGRTIRTHGPSRCLGPEGNDKGPYCCIHNPSDHPLNTAPLSWMQEMNMMFRVCKHGSIHPDPDALLFHQMLAFVGRAVPYDGYHPCCPTLCCYQSPAVDE